MKKVEDRALVTASSWQTFGLKHIKWNTNDKALVAASSWRDVLNGREQQVKGRLVICRSSSEEVVLNDKNSLLVVGSTCEGW